MAFDGVPSSISDGLRKNRCFWCGLFPGTGSGEDGPLREEIEAALAHLVRNRVEAAYARSDLFERRRVLMEEWAYQCQRGPSSSIEVYK